MELFWDVLEVVLALLYVSKILEVLILEESSLATILDNLYFEFAILFKLFSFFGFDKEYVLLISETLFIPVTSEFCLLWMTGTSLFILELILGKLTLLTF